MSLRVAIAYDGSAGADAAVRAAGALFGGAAATIVSVATPPFARPSMVGLAVPTISPELVEKTLAAIEAESVEEARAVAAPGVERALAAGLRAEDATPMDAPVWSAVLAAAGAAGADVLVCGMRGRGGLARAVLGSTSTSLLHHATIPLLVVPDRDVPLDGPAVIAYDGSADAGRAIAAAGHLFGGREAIVLHVWRSQYRRSLTASALSAAAGDVGDIVDELDRSLSDAAEQTTAGGVEAARAAGLDASGETLESGDRVSTTVAEAASARRAAVIACGARGLGGARSALLGSVSSSLVHHAELPILIAPAGE